MQGSKLFVGNLVYSLDEGKLKELFEQFGTVKELKLFGDKGFAFVEMSSSEEAESAKNGLNGKDLEGRSLKVDEARPRANNGPRNFNSNSGGNRRYNNDRY